MTLEECLNLLEEKLETLSKVIVSITFHKEVDANINRGFIKGRIRFVDGSCLDFSEQLPVERRKFRFHYMDAQNKLITRWDSAPHHPELPTHPFHMHRPEGIVPHPPITLLEVLEKVELMLSRSEASL